MNDKPNRRHNDADIEERIVALEAGRPDIDKLIALKDDIQTIVELMTQMRSAFRAFVTVGNFLKWLFKILIPFVALYCLFTKRDYHAFLEYLTNAD